MTARFIAGLGAITLGLGVAVAAIIGPLGLGLIQFQTTSAVEQQFIGGEIVSLLVVAPLAVGSGVLWLRRHRLAPAVSLGPALYTIYTYTTVVVGQEYARYAGNVEHFFPLFAGLIALSVCLVVFAWSRLEDSALPEPGETTRRLLAGIFMLLGAFFALSWIAQIRQVLGGAPTTEYLDAPTLFWTIKLLDLGFIVPVLMLTGIGLLRRWPRAALAVYGLAPFCTCLALAIAGMAAAMVTGNDPAAQPAMLMVALAAGLGLAAVTFRHLREAGRGHVGYPSAARLRQQSAPLGGQ